MCNEEGGKKNIFTLLPLLPLTERSHEKGAYLGEIKSKMRESGRGLGKGDDHGQNRQGSEEGRGGGARPGVDVWAGWIWGEY